MDESRRTRAGRDRIQQIAVVEAGERFGHLAARRVASAEKKNPTSIRRHGLSISQSRASSDPLLLNWIRNSMIPAAPALLLGILGLSPADPKGNLANRIAAPLSPGAVALLYSETRDPAVIARVGQALRDPRSETRAAAARLATVSPHARARKRGGGCSCRRDGRGSRARGDARARRDRGRSERRAALPRVGTVQRCARFLYLAKILARQRGPRAMAALLSARPWNLTPGEWANAVWLAARGDGPSLVPALARALGHRGLRTMGRPSPALRAQGCRGGAHRGRRGAVVPRARRGGSSRVVRRVGPPAGSGRSRLGVHPEARAPEGANADTVFVFDLLGRSFGKRPAGGVGEWGAAFRDAKRSLVDEMPPKSPGLGVMTETERQVVRLRREQLEPAARERGCATPQRKARPILSTRRAKTRRRPSI